MMKLELHMPSAGGVGQESIDLLRPQIREFVAAAMQDFVERMKSKLGGSGHGRVYQGRRASVPGQAPARQSGEYAGSFQFDIKEYKRSTHGRVGSYLWQRFGDSLEVGSKTIRPRPHVGPVFEQWRRAMIRTLEQVNHG